MPFHRVVARRVRQWAQDNQMNRKQKLELTWIGKEDRPKLEPRILIEEPEQSYHAAHRVTDHDIFDNRLILRRQPARPEGAGAGVHGEGSSASSSTRRTTRVSAFEHYDDGLEHSMWLSLMRERLELLCVRFFARRWVSFGSRSMTTRPLPEGLVRRDVWPGELRRLIIFWEKALAGRTPRSPVSSLRTTTFWSTRKTERVERQQIYGPTDAQIATPRSDEGGTAHWRLVGRGPWFPEDATGCVRQRSTDRSKRAEAFVSAQSDRSRLPSGRRSYATAGRPLANRCSLAETFTSLRDDKDDTVRGRGQQRPVIEDAICPKCRQGRRAYDHVAATKLLDNTQSCRRRYGSELSERRRPFATPKPERLTQRISRDRHEARGLGSRFFCWLRDHRRGCPQDGPALDHGRARRALPTHIVPRLQKVIDGTDPGGITEATWVGRAAAGSATTASRPPCSKRQVGQLGHQQGIQRRDARRGALQARRLRLRAERDRLLAARPLHRARLHLRDDADLTHEQLLQLSDDVGTERSLLVLCTAFRGKTDAYPNLTVKKIPKTVLSRCEWGHDDYSLKWRTCSRRRRPSGQQGLGIRGLTPMHRHVNAIAGRLSLRAPQRHSLEILDRITELAPLEEG